MNVTNLTSEPLSLDIEIIENTLPGEWWVTICLVNCYAPGQTKVEDERMGPSETHPLKLTITTGSEAANGYVKLSVKNHANPFDNAIVTYDVSATTVSIANISSPRQLMLAQNYPNPVSIGGNAVTTIAYGVPRAGNVSLKVYNLLGKEVRTLVSEQKSQGMYTAIWDGKDSQGSLLPPGVYVYKLSNGKATQTRRMLITR